MHSQIHHYPRYQSANNLISYKNRHNCTWIPEYLYSWFFEFGSKIIIVLNNFLPPHSTLFWTKNLQLCQWSSSLSWIEHCRVHISSGSMFENFNNIFVFDSNESNICTETFASCSYKNNIGHILKLLYLPNALAFLSKMTKIMSTIDKKECVVLFCDFLIKDYIRRIRIHWE